MTESGFAWWCWTCGWRVAGGQVILVARAPGHTSHWWTQGPSPGRSQRSFPADSSSGKALDTQSAHFHLPWAPQV